MTYSAIPRMAMTSAAGTDHQSLAAMTGRPISTQAPEARASMPLTLLSANQSAKCRITEEGSERRSLLGAGHHTFRQPRASHRLPNADLQRADSGGPAE